MSSVLCDVTSKVVAAMRSGYMDAESSPAARIWHNQDKFAAADDVKTVKNGLAMVCRGTIVVNRTYG